MTNQVTIRRRRWLVGVTVMVAIIAAIAFYFYNKGPLDVRSAPATKIEALQLYDAYAKDSVTAGKTYGQQVLSVTGKVASATQNTSGNTVVLLQTNQPGAAVNCTFEDSTAVPATGTITTINGICGGLGQGDLELGIPGDVYLLRCYLKPEER